ncbi:hypothetical protein ADK94_25130 [Streptomyces sp. XY593]|nr:hypothetical protein ADK94_25130 [Streptomyces sp. XY593]KOU90171.1 hypothetical protein ADK92_35710 [Streptomyces sp. XY533]
MCRPCHGILVIGSDTHGRPLVDLLGQPGIPYACSVRLTSFDVRACRAGVRYRRWQPMERNAQRQGAGERW